MCPAWAARVGPRPRLSIRVENGDPEETRPEPRVVSDDDLFTLAVGLEMPSDVESSLRNGRVVLAVRR